MNPIKSPYELLMEHAGFAPASPGMVNTGQQMLINQSGIVPHFSDGGNVFNTNYSNAGDTLANILTQYGPIPQQFSAGGQPIPEHEQMQGILSRLSEVLSSQT